MTRSEIIQRVLIKLDEVTEFEEHDDVIEATVDSLLDESANDLLMVLPYPLLPLLELETTSLTQMGTGDYTNSYGYIPLPDDYLRLGQLKMQEWERPVFYAYPDGSAIAQKQQNPILRGGVSKPVCVYSGVTKGKRLYYYSLPAGTDPHVVDTAVYVKRHEADMLDGELIQPLTWQCVANTAQVMNMPNVQQLADTQVKNWLARYG